MLEILCDSSGFDDNEGGAWNLNRLAFARGSLLDKTLDVPGVSSPWLYVGGLFSAFCWHTEDLWMYSCNHLHTGATKTWYVIPAAAATKFERATRSLLPSLFQHAPDLLYQLVAMVAPADLDAQGVPVYRIHQRAGEFVITFPRAYHAGFSHGFNVAEAVNFATADWLPFGRNAMLCYSRHRRTPVFSMDRLLWRLACAEAPPISLSTADWLLPELAAVADDEFVRREAPQKSYHHLLLLGQSPQATAIILGLADACGIGTQFPRHPHAVQAYQAGQLQPPKEYHAEICTLARCTRGFRAFEEDLLTCVECQCVCKRYFPLSSLARSILLPDSDPTEAHECFTYCTLSVFFSGVTCVVPPPKSALAEKLGKDVKEQHGVPISACLMHADVLVRMYDSKAGLGAAAACGPNAAASSSYDAGSVVESKLSDGINSVKDGPSTTTSFTSERLAGKLVAWKRHDMPTIMGVLARLSERLETMV